MLLTKKTIDLKNIQTGLVKMSLNRNYNCVYIFSFLLGMDYPNDQTLS